MGGRSRFLDPHSGGNKIPEALRRETVARLERHAAAHFAGSYTPNGDVGYLRKMPAKRQTGAR